MFIVTSKLEKQETSVNKSAFFPIFIMIILKPFIKLEDFV